MNETPDDENGNPSLNGDLKSTSVTNTVEPAQPSTSECSDEHNIVPNDGDEGIQSDSGNQKLNSDKDDDDSSGSESEEFSR